MILLNNILLKDNSNYRIGGSADYYFEFDSVEKLKKAILEYKDIDSSLESVFILGSGTNVLFSDDGFRGLVLKNNLIGINIENNELTVAAGVEVQDLVDYAISNTLSGFEWAGGLPGTVGGAIRGNAGAFGGETKDNLVEVDSLNIYNLNVVKREKNECSFDYRQSIFKSGDGKHDVIISAKFEVEKGEKSDIISKTQKNIDYRENRHPLDHPNIGSIFKNIPIEIASESLLKEFEQSIKKDPFPVIPVAKILAVGGFKGKRVGDAQISEKHPNFIVNLGNASSKDVLSLIDSIKNEIRNKYNISLEEEITII